MVFENVQSNLFEQYKGKTYILFQQYFSVPKSWSLLKQPHGYQEAQKQFHVIMATIMQILTSIYLIHSKRSPLTGEAIEHYPTEEIIQRKTHLRSKSFNSSFGQQFSPCKMQF